MKNGFLKKLSILFLIATMLFSASLLFACNETDATDDKDDRPQIVIGSDEYPPFFYIDEDGNFSGIDVEIATKACERIGYKAVFKKIEWSDKDILLVNGEVDCLWGCFSMTGREDRYDWIGPYMKSSQVVAVLANSDIYTFADLAEKNIAVQATSIPDEILSAHDDERIPDDIRLYCFTDFDIIFSSLDNGYVDAIAGHDTIMAEYMKENPSKYRILEEPLLEVNLGAAFLKGENTALVDLLKQSVQVLLNDGTIAEIVTKYGLDPEKVLAL